MALEVWQWLALFLGGTLTLTWISAYAISASSGKRLERNKIIALVGLSGVLALIGVLIIGSVSNLSPRSAIPFAEIVATFYLAYLGIRIAMRGWLSLHQWERRTFVILAILVPVAWVVSTLVGL
jgi:hypothetical protein